MCGAAWTHVLQVLPPSGGAAPTLLVTERGSGEATTATLLAPAADVLYGNATRAGADVPGGLLPSEPAAAEALVGAENVSARETSAALRRRLVGTGPWKLGSVGDVYLLRRGAAYNARERVWGSWTSIATPDGPQAQLLLGKQLSQLTVDCWKLALVGKAATAHSLSWPQPAARCFSSCSDKTHAATTADLAASALARYVSALTWSWGKNREGLHFRLENGEGMLDTPWGHGSWGVVPTRDDVLFAEFAQQRHMLRFNLTLGRYISTRCADGDTVEGEVLRATGT